MRWLIVLLMIFGGSASASAQSSKAPSWGPQGNTPTSSSFIPKLKSGEAYSERYTFNIPLDGGGEVYLDFTVSNLGWGDNKGATSVRVKLPGQKTYTYRKELDADEWAMDRKSFNIRMGKSTVQANGNGYSLRHEGNMPFELKLENVVPSWKPGSGKIDVNDETFQLALMSPKARVSGRIKVDGQWQPVSSANGMGDWSMSTIAPYDLAQRFSRFRADEGDYAVVWREIQTVEDLGGKSVVWVLVTKGDTIVFASANATLVTSGFVHDDKSDYDVPRTFQITAREGENRISLKVRGGKMKVRDLLAEYGAVARTIAGTKTSPFQFNSDAAFTLKLNTVEGETSVSGRGPLGIDILN